MSAEPGLAWNTARMSGRSTRTREREQATGDARTQIDLIGAASVLIGLQLTSVHNGGSGSRRGAAYLIGSDESGRAHVM
jgi:hypothetical protein